MNKEDIEKKGRIITTLLLQKGKLSLSYLCKMTGEDSTSIILALGHLVGKGRITVSENGNDLVINSTYTFSNMYY
jgi:hypothetical protein